MKILSNLFEKGEFMDKDLMSIQEVRDLLTKAKQAQSVYATFSQEKVG